MKKVMVFTYLQRHLRKMLPIIKELNKDKNISLNVIILTEEEKDIALQNSICFRMLDEFTSKKRVYDFDLGWGMGPLINAIKTIKPDLFLAIEVNYILRNAIRYCKQQGIPNLIVQHGTPNKYSLHAFAPFEGDCFAAWGDFTKKFLADNGVDLNKIVVTGGVPFDRTLSLKPDKERISSETGIDPGKKWIVFTTQGSGAGNCPSEEEIIAGITETAARATQYPDHQLIFQVHPGQTIKYVQDILDDIEHNAVVVKYKDTEELIAASEGVITFFSTTAIDAVILKKPLLLINLTDDRDFLPFVDLGVALGAYQKEDINSAFDKLLANPRVSVAKRDKAANYVNYKNDGKALERIMSLCYDKLNCEKGRR